MSLKRPLFPIILFTGGDMNNVDKGRIPASLGKIFQMNGKNVVAIKYDPCWNHDSLAINPDKYGEKYILRDGNIVSVNFGNYERILGQFCTEQNYITNAKINDILRPNNYVLQGDKILTKNFTAAIIQWISNVCRKPINDSGNLPDICLIELCRKDNMKYDKKFMAALKEFRYNGNPFIHVHISSAVGGKFDFIEKSVKTLRDDYQLQTDIIIFRSRAKLSDNYEENDPIYGLLKSKTKMIFNLPINLNIKEFPIHLKNVYNLIAKTFNVQNRTDFEVQLNRFKKVVQREKSYKNTVRIALVGKFWNPLTHDFQDCYESVIQQLNMAAAKCECKVQIEFVRAQHLESQESKEDYDAAWTLLYRADGIFIPSAFKNPGTNGMIAACKYARENKKPLLSFCYAFQVALTEFTQNCLLLYTGERFQNAIDTVFTEMLEGDGKPRNGERTITILTTNSKLFELYGQKVSFKDRFCNKFEIDPWLIPFFVKAGLRFVGIGFDEDGRGNYLSSTQKMRNIVQLTDDEKEYNKIIDELCKCYRETEIPIRMEMFELKNHPFYVGLSYHPKCNDAEPSAPSPPYIGLIHAALDQKNRIELPQKLPSNFESAKFSNNKKKSKQKKKGQKFVFQINCKNPVKDGILKIAGLTNFLQTKFLNSNVEADKFKITLFSTKEISKKRLRNLIKNYLTKNSFRKCLRLTTFSKTVFKLKSIKIE